MLSTNKENRLMSYRHIAQRLTLMAPILLAACGTIRPDPITQEEHAQRAQDDMATLLKVKQPITGPLTLAEAIARALKFNYDAELSRIEQSLQERQIDLAMAQMLPRLAANAGYTLRDNYNAARSVSLATRQTSLDYSYSELPGRGSASLQFSWNALDVGVGYFQAKQQAYRALVAVERRRKVLDNLVKGVQEAFWRAAVAQQVLPQLAPVLAQAETMLANSRTAARQRLQPRAQALEYQDGLLQVITQLRRLRTDLSSAKIRLASLIDVPPGSEFTLVIPPMGGPARPGTVDIVALEQLGLNLRPELREAAYQEKIDRQDVYKEMIKMMPGIGILGSLNYDSNRLLYNHTWGDIGIRATYNLVSLIEGPQAISAARTSVEVSKARRLALGVAVLTQVNLGYQEYLTALDELGSASEIESVQRELASTAAGATASDAQPESARVKRALSAMAATFERGRALADSYGALTNLYAATGVDIVPADVDTNDLPALIVTVEQAIKPWQEGQLPVPPPGTITTPRAQVAEGGAPPASE